MSVDLSRPRRLYFVGLGGMGMSALARLLTAQGHQVAGSDQADSTLLAELRQEGIAASVGHDAARVRALRPDAVVVSAAIRADNDEVGAARALGVRVLTLAEVVGQIAAERRVLAIGGTHGKTTTTSMVAFVLERLGRSPSYLIGGHVPDLGGNARFGGEPLVIEADEYAGRMLTLTPTVAVVTNLEHDHPDVYPTMADVVDVFRRWLAQVRAGGLVVLRHDDPGCAALAPTLTLAPGVRRETFGLWPGNADWTVEPLPPPAGSDERAMRGLVRRGGEPLTPLTLRLAGHYNLLNALAAIVVCASEGVAPALAAATLGDFAGVARRFEIVGEAGGVTIIDEYAHHPTAVREALTAARARYPDGRLVCLFQPHTYSRTRALFDDFAAALRLADVAVVLPVYAAREPVDPQLTAERLATAVGARAVPVTSIVEAVDALLRLTRDGDTVLTVGAGDVTSAGPALLARLSAAAPESALGREPN